VSSYHSASKHIYLSRKERINVNLVKVLLLNFLCISVGRDSATGTATHYGMGGQGIETQWGQDFPHPTRPALESTQLSIKWVPGLCPEGKAAGVWR
jgi:hypothetical protein